MRETLVRKRRMGNEERRAERFKGLINVKKHDRIQFKEGTQTDH